MAAGHADAGIQKDAEGQVKIHRAGNAVLCGLLFCASGACRLRARPYGQDPNKCIFEAYAIELYPEGQEPETQWVHAPSEEREKWPSVLLQDFDNMGEVQKGMRSRGFRRALMNPMQERKVLNLHHNLARYMEMGAPQPFK